MNQNINIKIMKKPELSDEEIRSHMQFDKVLEAYKATGPVRYFENWNSLLGYSVATIVVILTALYLLLPKSKEVIQNKPKPTPAIVLDSSLQTKKQEVTSSTQKPETQKPRNEIAKPKTPIRNEAQPLPVEEKRTALSQFIQAEPVEGYAALYEYFDRELKYPVEALRDSVEGIVSVSFAITKDGKPSALKIENSLGDAFDKECERVIMAMPLWKPATINNKPIATRLSIPLTFKIKK